MNTLDTREVVTAWINHDLPREIGDLKTGWHAGDPVVIKRALENARKILISVQRHLERDLYADISVRRQS